MKSIRFYYQNFLLKYCTAQYFHEDYCNRLNQLSKSYIGEYPLAFKAEVFAKMIHASVNHKYNDKSYAIHLTYVYDIALKYLNLIDDENKDIVLAACWLHDTIEDCRLTHSDIKKLFGIEVANIVYDLTNEKGKNRKERANDSYYQGIKKNELSVFVKTCDRIANLKYSINESFNSGFDLTTSKLFMYSNETKDFIGKLYVEKYKSMFIEDLATIANMYSFQKNKIDINKYN